MTFLETDVQGSDHLCHDLLEDLTAVESGAVESREFIGNAHAVTISSSGITIDCLAQQDAEDAQDGKANAADPASADTHTTNAEDPTKQDRTNQEQTKYANAEHQYATGLKHFREVLEDWEAFILDDQSPA